MENNNKNKKLGKGLQTIFAEYNLLDKIKELEEGAAEHQVKIDLDLIETNPFQPRIQFNQEKIIQLAESIKIYGVITPILVRKHQEKFQLIAGERRTRAARLAGLIQIPAVIADFSDDQMLELALVENIQREDLSVIEEAQGYYNLVKQFGYTQQQLAKKIQKSRSHIANIMRLLSLPKEVQDDISSKKVTMGQVKPLIGLEPDQARELSLKIQEEKLNARKVEKLLKKKLELEEYQQELKNILKKYYQIEIEFGKNNLKLTYKSKQDLIKLLEKLK